MPELGELTLPETEQYRVVGVGATYRAPQEVIGGDGQPTIVYTQQVAAGREVISLVAAEARRLQALGAVKPVDEPKSYDEMDDHELDAEVSRRGISVRSSGADSEQPLRTDKINALTTFDLGSDQGLVGVSSHPGGVELVTDQQHRALTLDGETPPEQAGEPGNPGELPDERLGFVSKASRESDGNGAGGFSAEGKSVTEVAQWISTEKPNTRQTVAAANDDPELAKVVLEAEKTASQGDPRQPVVSRLEKIQNRDEQ